MPLLVILTGLYAVAEVPNGKLTAVVRPPLPMFCILSVPVLLLTTNLVLLEPLMLEVVPVSVRLFVSRKMLPFVNISMPPTFTFPASVTPAVLLTARLLKVAAGMVCAEVPEKTTTPPVFIMEPLKVKTPLMFNCDKVLLSVKLAEGLIVRLLQALPPSLITGRLLTLLIKTSVAAVGTIPQLQLPAVPHAVLMAPVHELVLETLSVAGLDITAGKQAPETTQRY